MPEPTERFSALELPGWEEKRSTLRREDDRKMLAFLGSVVVTAFTIGVAWATATAAVHQKVDKADQVGVDARQDAQLTAVLDGLRRLNAGVDSANLRLYQMACAGKPPSCR